MPSVAELIAALPEPADARDAGLPAPLNPLLEAWSHRPVPVGRFRRLRMLGALQAQIAAAYAFYWLRGWFTTLVGPNNGSESACFGFAVRVNPYANPKFIGEDLNLIKPGH